MVQPLDEAVIPAGSSVTLDTSEYNDPDGDDHVETVWEVWRADSGDLLPGYQYYDSGLTDHVIDELVLDEGLKYGWRVAYVDSDGNPRWSPKYYFKVGTPVPESLPEIAAGKSLGDFGMISIVHWPNDPDPQAVFNITYDANNYRIGTWDPEQDKYIEFGQGLVMEPGKAYWVLARNPLAVNFSGVPVNTGYPVEVCLYTHPSTGKGWNMIAPPNAADYRWNDVLVGRWVEDPFVWVEPVPVTDPVASTLINHRIYEWQNGAYIDHRLDENFVLEQNKGYWVEAILDGVYLEFNSSAQVAGLSTPRTTLLAWKGKAVRWMKRLLPVPREAIAEGDSPPMPMESLDGNSDPLFEGCFVQTTR